MVVLAAFWIGAAAVLSPLSVSATPPQPDPVPPPQPATATPSGLPTPSAAVTVTQAVQKIIDLLPVPEPLDVTIAFTGDVLTHMPVNQAARTANGYDFNPLFATISPWIEGADLAICQLEVPVAPPGRAITGYPVFAAPRAVIPALANQGWDGCATSTNHSLDQGWSGVQTTIDDLTANGMGYVGTALSAEDAELAQLYRFTKDGQTLTIAHLSTSYGFNGFSQPKGKPWAAATNNVDQITARAKAARAAGADIVLLSVHLGTEYVTKPTTQQTKFMADIAETGVIDAVIGGHPHVVEPIEKLPGGVNGQGMWVVYSLGNMISNMTQPIRKVGLIDYVKVTKDADGARVTGMTWSAIMVDQDGKFKLYALADANGGNLGRIPAGTVSSLHKQVKNIVGPEAPEQQTPPTPSGAKLTVLPHA